MNRQGARWSKGLLLAGCWCIPLARSALIREAHASAATDDPALTAGDEDPRRAARAHFDKGLALFDRQIWDAALAEFSRSQELYPTRSALKNAALCLKHLARYGDAASLLMSVLKNEATAPEERDAIERELKELSPLIGTIRVRSPRAGMKVWIDGELRGETPMLPQSVSVGDHSVHVETKDSPPFDTRVTVASREAVLVEVTWLPTPNRERTPPPQSALASPAPDSPGSVRRDRGAGRPRSQVSWAPPIRTAKIRIEVEAGLALTLVSGGDVAASCRGECQSSLEPGVLGALRASLLEFRGVRLFFDAGYLALRSAAEPRRLVLHPVNLPDNQGSARDTLTLAGVLMGVTGELPLACIGGQTRRCTWPFSARLGGGVLIGRTSDRRVGEGVTNARPNPNAGSADNEPAEFPGRAYHFDVSESASSFYGYLAPELRVGYSLALGWELSLALRGYLLVAFKQPRFRNVSAVVPGPDYHVGSLIFDSQTTSGRTVFGVTPLLSVSHAFF